MKISTKNWGPLAATLAKAGLPALGAALGGIVKGGLPGWAGMIVDTTKIGRDTGEWAAKAIAEALGVPPDPEVITEVIQANGGINNPDIQSRLLQVQEEAKAKYEYLTEVVKQDTAQLDIEARSAEQARQWALQASESGNTVQSMAPIVLGAIIVVCFFGFMTILLLFPPARPNEQLLILTGTLASAFGAVVGYYFGSSAGSKRNADRLAAVSMVAATEKKSAPGTIEVTPPATVTSIKSKK